jgi:nitrate reductase assembly molybdenum cofactor insertion protein NarJ
MTEATTEPETPHDRLNSALIHMRGICAVLEELAEGGDEKALLYLVNRFNADCEAAQSAYDELFDFQRSAQ